MASLFPPTTAPTLMLAMGDSSMDVVVDASMDVEVDVMCWFLS